MCDNRTHRRLQQIEGLPPEERRQLTQWLDAFIEREQLKRRASSPAASRWIIPLEKSLQIHTAKQDAIAAISRLSGDAPLGKIVYRLYVLIKTHQGVQDIEAGQVLYSDELAYEIERW